VLVEHAAILGLERAEAVGLSTTFAGSRIDRRSTFFGGLSSRTPAMNSSSSWQ
jgi:hypothetical protein